MFSFFGDKNSVGKKMDQNENFANGNKYLYQRKSFLGFG